MWDRISSRQMMISASCPASIFVLLNRQKTQMVWANSSLQRYSLKHLHPFDSCHSNLCQSPSLFYQPISLIFLSFAARLLLLTAAPIFSLSLNLSNQLFTCPHMHLLPVMPPPIFHSISNTHPLSPIPIPKSILTHFYLLPLPFSHPWTHPPIPTPSLQSPLNLIHYSHPLLSVSPTPTP